MTGPQQEKELNQPTTHSVNNNPQVVGCYKDFNFDNDQRSLKGSE